jgi:hypothetical protein
MAELLSSPWKKEHYWKLRGQGDYQDIVFLAPVSKAAEYLE